MVGRKTVSGYNRTDSSTGTVTLGTVIQHPNQFYASRSGASYTVSHIEGNTQTTTSKTHSSWCSDIAYNLWNANGRYEPYGSDDRTYDIPVVKTVYDPCPVGFKVPNRNAFVALALQDPAVDQSTTYEPYTGVRTDWSDSRYTFDTIEGNDLLIFPRTGLLDYSTGDFRKNSDDTYAEFRVFIHTSCISGRWNNYHVSQGGMASIYFQLDDSNVNPPKLYGAHGSGACAYGMGVRPIADE